jgi:peptide deformylase
MKLVNYSDPILTTPCQTFNFSDPPFDPIQFAKDIVKFMHENNGIGLAANQVGVPYKVFCMRGHPENFVCYNPKIVWYSDTKIELEEGCLTYPGLTVKITRPQHIRVRFNTPNGDTLTKQFTGMSSRIFQHEFDHLDGNVFYNKANRYHRDTALKKWKR